jgi:hypothetical protein
MWLVRLGGYFLDRNDDEIMVVDSETFRWVDKLKIKNLEIGLFSGFDHLSNCASQALDK